MNSVCIVLVALFAVICAQYQQQQYGQQTNQMRQYTTPTNQYQQQQYGQQPQYNQQQQQMYNPQTGQYQSTQSPYYANTQTSNLNRQYDQNGQVFFNSVSPVSASLALLSSAAAMLLL